MDQQVLAEIKQELHRIRDDTPGERFQNHHERSKRGARWVALLTTVAGLLTLALGVVMLVTPGPGILGILFGLALLAGRSRRLAGLLDRAEPGLRRWGADVRRRWDALPLVARAVLVVVGGAVTAAMTYGAYRFWYG